MTQTEPEFEPAPLCSTPRRVPPEWIDYNGHMNVAYYTLAFDQALDEILEPLGIGEGLARDGRMGPMALQCQIHHLSELLEGTEFCCEFQLLDADAKRTHKFLRMINLDTGQMFGQRDARIVAGLHDHAAQQIFQTDLLADFDEHARAFGLPGLLAHVDHVIQGDIALLELVEDDVGRHQFGN